MANRAFFDQRLRCTIGSAGSLGSTTSAGCLQPATIMPKDREQSKILIDEFIQCHNLNKDGFSSSD